MLKVLGDGVEITLAGQDKNPLFLFSALLVICAILVAVIALIAPVKITLLAFFVLACLVFGFNLYKNKRKNHTTIALGVLVIKNSQFSIQGQTIKLSKNAQITINENALMIEDLSRLWEFRGFETTKELEIAKCVLEGRVLQKQAKAIRLNA